MTNVAVEVGPFQGRMRDSIRSSARVRRSYSRAQARRGFAGRCTSHDRWAVGLPALLGEWRVLLLGAGPALRHAKPTQQDPDGVVGALIDLLQRWLPDRVLVGSHWTTSEKLWTALVQLAESDPWVLWPLAEPAGSLHDVEQWVTDAVLAVG